MHRAAFRPIEQVEIDVDSTRSEQAVAMSVSGLRAEGGGFVRIGLEAALSIEPAVGDDAERHDVPMDGEGEA